MVEVSSQEICGLHIDHADIRRETQTGFGETRYNIAERAGDIRREAAEHTNEIVKEGLKAECTLRGDVKDARHDVNMQVGNSADRVVDRVGDNASRVTDRLMEVRNLIGDRFMTVARDTQDIRAQIVAEQQQLVAGFLGVAKDTEIASLKGVIEGQKNTAYLADKLAFNAFEAQKNTQYLSDKFTADGDKTRQLINELKNADCNRMLIERNAEIVEHRHYGHHWRGQYDQNQWQNLSQQLASQTANFNSQLSEARQGMVNFGTMAGVGQSSTNNNVR